MVSVSVAEVAVKPKVSLFHTAGFGVPDPEVKVLEVLPAFTRTVTGPPNRLELPP